MPTSTPLQASTSRERIEVLDVWRGFALLGVCIVNFMLTNNDFLTAERGEQLATGGYDWRAALLIHSFFSNKAHTIFTFMFGVGLAIIVERAGDFANRIVLRRLLTLYVFGLAHYLLVYQGDILHTYAVLGLVVIFLSRWIGSSALIVVGAALAIAARLCFEERAFLLGLVGWTLPPATSNLPFMDANALYVAKESYDVWDAIQLNAQRALATQSDIARNAPTTLYFLGRVMLGYAFWTLGWGRRLLALNTRTLAPIVAAMVVISVLMTFAINTMRNGSAGSFGHFAYNSIRHASFLIIAATYLAAWIYVCRLRIARPISNAFAAVGRMSLTNYVMQSVAMFVLLYGVGLRLGGNIGTAMTALIAAGFFVAQTVFSMLWLRRFDQGPLEWCWRKIVYSL